MRYVPPVLALTLFAAPALAGPTVSVVVGPDAPKLERFAADELAALLKQLFDAEAAVGTRPAAADYLILVGSPTTNPAIPKAGWPKLSEQGHVLRSITAGDRKALAVGGGSPVATLWAVYELGHHFGVRSFLHGDVMPEKVPPLKFDGIDLTLEPAERVRAWIVLGDLPVGFAAWGLADSTQLLKQLAKLKFNAVVVRTEPGKPVATFGGRKFPVSGDTPGRKAFRGAKEFENPDLTGKTGEERKKAGDALVLGTGEAASALGIEVGYVGPDVRLVVLPGVLPRVPTATLPTREKHSGFVVDATVPGDLSPTAYFLARRAFDPKLTPKDAHAQLFTPILGAASAERVALGFSLIDQADALVRKSDPAFDPLAPGFFTKLANSSDAPPEWWKQAGKLYAGAMDEMYRGIRATFNDPARPTLLYYAKRCEFAVHFFAAMDAARLAGQAREKRDKEAVVMQLEKATESVYNSLNALGDVARDQSDRGVIAVLAETAYRPLKAELKAADKK